MVAIRSASIEVALADDAPALTREQLTEHIRALNPSAPADWLDQFDDEALAHYLDHLQTAMEPRGRSSRWVRRGETPAIVGWRRDDDQL